MSTIIEPRQARLCVDQPQAALQSASETLQRRLGRVARATLDTADVGLPDPREIRKLTLRQATSNTGVVELEPKSDRSSEPPTQLSLRRRLSGLMLCRPFVELGPHGKASPHLFCRPRQYAL